MDPRVHDELAQRWLERTDELPLRVVAPRERPRLLPWLLMLAVGIVVGAAARGVFTPASSTRVELEPMKSERVASPEPSVEPVPLPMTAPEPTVKRAPQPLIRNAEVFESRL